MREGAIRPYSVRIEDSPSPSTERVAAREIQPPREFVRPTVESGYVEVRQLLGRPPDLANLRGSETVQKLISEQKALEAEGNGHAFLEHRASTTQLRERAEKGTRARDGEQGDYIPPNATGFRSDEAALAAIVVGWSQPETIIKRTDAERRYNAARARGASQQELERIAVEDMTIRHSFPIERALGHDWRQQVEGYSRLSVGQEATIFGDNTQIQAYWDLTPDGKWYVVTCFPRP